MDNIFLKNIIRDILLEEFIDYNTLHPDIPQLSNTGITLKLSELTDFLKNSCMNDDGHFVCGYIDTGNKKEYVLIPIYDHTDINAYFKHGTTKGHTFNYLDDDTNSIIHTFHIIGTVTVIDYKLQKHSDKISDSKKYKIYQMHSSMATGTTFDFF